MDIKLHEIPIRDLVVGYTDSAEEGVVGYGGNLDIRPKYQREFIYKDKQRDAVIETVMNDFPLNVMYWVDNGDGKYEVLDGQQRIISICQFVAGMKTDGESPMDYVGTFSVVLGPATDDRRYFHNLEVDERQRIPGYRLMVYFRRGTDSEKLAWFKTINIAGEKLTDQELRNAVFAGPWVTDAKRYFSKTGCPAYGHARDYVRGVPIRQEYLETAIDWLSDGNIWKYMGRHKHDASANPLWLHFKAVIDWAKVTFPKYRKEMKGAPWGPLYTAHREEELVPAKLEDEVARLMADDDVTKKSGVYSYVLNRDEKHLNIRAFTESQKRAAYERQKGKCKKCKKPFDIGEMQADHITPWSKGGHTVPKNCQMLCGPCNRAKSDV